MRAAPRGYVAAAADADDAEGRLHRSFARRVGPTIADLALVCEDLEDPARHGWRKSAEVIVVDSDAWESEDVAREAGPQRLADACRVVFGEAAATPPAPDPEVREAQMLALVLCRLSLEAALRAVEDAGSGGDRDAVVRELEGVDALVAAAEGLAAAPVVDALKAARRPPAGR